MGNHQPLVLRVLARFIPGDLREPIAGDLHEEYLEMRERHGAARAGRWLWWQSLRLAVVVRPRATLAPMVPMLKNAVIEMDRNQPVGTIRTMEDLIAASVAPRRLNLWLVGAFAAVALVLTVAGLYGVMSYLVAQRTREIGVRLALDASRGSVLALMLRQAGTMMFFGIGTGFVGALALTRSLSSLLFGVTTKDPAIYAGVSLLLAMVALLAIAVPSSRATRVDPLAALHGS